MTSAARPARAPAPLRSDSLAFALQQAATLVEAVQAGGNLTDAFERLLASAPHWPDATRGALRDLAWGTLRDYARGDAVLARFLHKPLPPALHALLLVAWHRLETRPDTAHTVVNQAVEVAARLAPGLKGVVNGVLRNALREQAALVAWLDAEPVTRWRHPAWWIARLHASFPDAWEGALAAANQRPPMALRANRRRTTAQALAAELHAAGHPCRVLAHEALLLERPLPVAALPGFAEGRLSVQDAGAQWAAQWLDLAPGQRVLDACAAPGGKTAHILELADVELTALEVDPARIARLRANLDRLGLSAQVRRADCRATGEWWDGRPFARILADVPCSASGVARRHPDIKWLRRANDIAGFAAQQRAILDALWPTLAPGGKLLYVTCSLFEEENGAQIEAFCRRHPDAQRVPLAGRAAVQWLPCAEHDGFFYALLAKRG